MTNMFYGVLGFCHTNEVSPGVWEPSVIERNYYGEFVTNYRKWEQADQINPNLKFVRTLSVVADDYLISDFFALSYVVDGGMKWKVNKVDLAYPRLTITLGDRYIEEDDDDRT